MRIGVNLCLFWLRITCNIHHKIHNKTCIDPKLASIVLSRHESTWEALAFHTIFPSQINVVKKELLRIPFFGFILVTINSILIDRKQALKAIKQVKREGKKAIEENLWASYFLAEHVLNRVR
jgi:1-acyl-sn-glycerol-3-phosphate acyltransferase